MHTIPLPHLTLALVEHWGLTEARIQPLIGGMTSAVWTVDHSEGRWVAKAVHINGADGFARGLEIAARLEQTGFAAGGPRPTLDGQNTVFIGEWALALLLRVEGAELTGETESDLRLIGRTLGEAHKALGTASVGQGNWVGWDSQADYLAVQSWVRPAVEAGIAGVERLGLASLSWGYVHGDPAPEAFLFDADTGRCGLIDWGAAQRAPLLHDLASGVMYAGGPDAAEPLIQAYCETGAMPAAEITRGLWPALDYRQAGQAAYFAWRIARNDMTGIDDPAENDEGLDHARAYWFERAAALDLTLPNE
jgi:homoserine kinase type II